MKEEGKECDRALTSYRVKGAQTHLAGLGRRVDGGMKMEGWTGGERKRAEMRKGQTEGSRHCFGWMKVERG